MFFKNIFAFHQTKLVEIKKKYMKPSVISNCLGGGRGSRLFPLTDKRSKPAVPITGKYRLVDIPISNCLNSGFNRIMVLTQFNSASLNSHIKTPITLIFLAKVL